MSAGRAEDGSPSSSEWTDRLITALSGQVLPAGDVDGMSLLQGASLADFLRGHGTDSLHELIATVSRRMSRGNAADNGTYGRVVSGEINCTLWPGDMPSLGSGGTPPLSSWIPALHSLPHGEDLMKAGMKRGREQVRGM